MGEEFRRYLMQEGRANPYTEVIRDHKSIPAAWRLPDFHRVLDLEVTKPDYVSPLSSTQQATVRAILDHGTEYARVRLGHFANDWANYMSSAAEWMHDCLVTKEAIWDINHGVTKVNKYYLKALQHKAMRQQDRERYFQKLAAQALETAIELKRGIIAIGRTPATPAPSDATATTVSTTDPTSTPPTVISATLLRKRGRSIILD